MLKSRATTLAISAAGLMIASTLAAGPCPPDINCSGGVDVDDLLAVVDAWGASGGGGASDIDGSGAVDVDDLLGVISAWGPCVFDFGPAFPNEEAHQIGLEMLGPNGALVLPQSTYDRIDTDLGLIRSEFPALQSETHTLAWAPNQLIVGLASGQPQDGYACLNAYYQVVKSDFLFQIGGTAYYVITFAGKLNVEALAGIYTALPEVNSAEPNGLVGGQNFWVPTQLANGNWRWDIDDGFHDCFDGCDCHQVYVIRTTPGGDVVLISYTEFGQPWCRFE